MPQKSRSAPVPSLAELLRSSLVLIKSGKGFKLRIEPIAPGLETLTSPELMAIRDRVISINSAIRRGHIGVTPGLASVRLTKPRQAIEALAPGVFDPKIWKTSKGRQFLAVAGGQLIPPGVTIDLTPQETDQLLDLLVVAGPTAALGAFLESCGLLAVAAAAVAAVLLTLALQVKICKELSATGAVGFKILFIPPLPPVVIPYPV